jgi:dephospho-CoA kinase
MDRKCIRGILDAQLPDSERISFADDIIENNSGLDALQQSIVTLHNNYLDLFSKNETLAAHQE